MHEHVIEALVAQFKVAIERGEEPIAGEDAPVVRKLANGTYELLSGHHRLEAARRVDLKIVPCWVYEDLSDETAYKLLLSKNTQTGLTQLEVGIHAVPLALSKGGRGKVGEIERYAKTIGRSTDWVYKARQAAEVYQVVRETLAPTPGFSSASLRDKAQHLLVIKGADEGAWSNLVVGLLKEGWSVKKTREQVGALTLAASGALGSKLDFRSGRRFRFRQRPRRRLCGAAQAQRSR